MVEGLLARGIIDREAAIAADNFKRAFRIAALETLRAADLSRIPGAHGRGFDPPVWARKQVGDTIDMLGGQRSLVASCLWHVIGLEWSLRRWARLQGGVNNQVACGILVAQLDPARATKAKRRPAIGGVIPPGSFLPEGLPQIRASKKGMPRSSGLRAGVIPV